MRQLLFCVDSYYQLMVSINLKTNIFVQDGADIVLYNSMNNAVDILKRLKKIRIFNNVYLANSSLNYPINIADISKRIPQYRDYIKSMENSEKFVKNVIGWEEITNYDFFFFYGYKVLTQSIFNVCKKNNNNIICYRIDDGMGTYIREWNVPKPLLRKLIEKYFSRRKKFNNIENYIKGFYVSDPKLIRYKLNYELLSIPSYNSHEIKSILNYVFNFKECVELKNKKIVYFTACGEKYIKRDIKFIKDILHIVDKDQILIKVHPRVDKNIFNQFEIDMIEQSFIPWELFMLNYSLNNTFFIGQISSAILSASIIFSGCRTSIFLCQYRVDGKTVLAKNEVDIIEFIMFLQKSNDHIKIPKSYDELSNVLMSDTLN